MQDLVYISKLRDQEMIKSSDYKQTLLTLIKDEALKYGELTTLSSGED